MRSLGRSHYLSARSVGRVIRYHAAHYERIDGATPVNDGPGTNEHPKTRAQGLTWLQTLALVAITGVMVFAVTREMYAGKAVSESVAGNDTAMASTTSSDQLIVNTAMLESLLKMNATQKDPETISLLANQYFDNRQYAEAADLYGQLAALDPANVDNLNNLGLTLQYVGRSDEALEVLTRGSRLDPGNQRIWLTLGFVNRSIGYTDAARSALQTAERIDPNSDVGKSASKMLAEL